MLPPADLADDYALKVWISPAVTDGLMTRNQWRAVLDMLTPKLPIRVHGMSCRTPKGVLATYRLSPRADWYHGAMSDEEFRARAQM